MLKYPSGGGGGGAVASIHRVGISLVYVIHDLFVRLFVCLLSPLRLFGLYCSYYQGLIGVTQKWFYARLGETLPLGLFFCVVFFSKIP